MTDRPTPSWNCGDPGLGALLEAYLRDRLEDAERDIFEEHYLACPGCVAELRFRASLALALDSAAQQSAVVSALPRPATRNRFPRGLRWGLAAGVLGGVLAAGLLLTVVFRSPGYPPVERGGPTPPPVILRLEVAVRSGGAIPQVPVGRPLELVLVAPLSSRDDATREAHIENRRGTEILRVSDLVPAGPFEVHVPFPHPPAQPGRYVAILRELLPGQTSSKEWRYTFETTATTPAP